MLNIKLGIFIIINNSNNSNNLNKLKLIVIMKKHLKIFIYFKKLLQKLQKGEKFMHKIVLHHYMTKSDVICYKRLIFFLFVFFWKFNPFFFFLSENYNINNKKEWAWISNVIYLYQHFIIFYIPFIKIHFGHKIEL